MLMLDVGREKARSGYQDTLNLYFRKAGVLLDLCIRVLENLFLLVQFLVQYFDHKVYSKYEEEIILVVTTCFYDTLILKFVKPQTS